MHFGAPIYLLLLFLVPALLCLYFLQRRQRLAVRFPAASTLAAIVPAIPAWRKHLPSMLVCAALILLVLAAAKPQRTVAEAVQRGTIVLITDVSRSMLATDIQPSRLDVARAAAKRFLDKVPRGIQVGSVSFSDQAAVLQRPTTDLDRVRSSLDALSAWGGTNTGEAITAALQSLPPERPGASGPTAAIILLSDGRATAGPDPEIAANAAKRKRVPVHTVAFGTQDGRLDDPSGFGPGIPVPPDPETMREIARITGGRAFTAKDAEQLDGIYKNLGSRLATETKTEELTVNFAGAGLILLLLAGIASTRLFPRLP